MVVPFRALALAFRLVALVLIATGLVRILGLLTPSPSWASLTYYTVLSNVLCLVWVAVLVWTTARDLRRRGTRGWSTPSPRFGGAVMEAITVTMLVYLVVLVPTTFQQAGDYEPFTLTDNLIHIITPCLLIADWLLFSPKGTFRWTDPLRWALIPYAYLLFAFTWSALGGTFGGSRRYPYPFMDVDAHGVGGVALWIAVLTVALVAVGYVFVAADRLLDRLAARGDAGSTATPGARMPRARPQRTTCMARAASVSDPVSEG
ncbi:Pr6Pr family membrane protein [Agromyces marinus]|uniref:Pr6Pr family membrane protein n=1 Tax=Agromyces marinus TaxID=1389020 RepID=A0ABM8GZ66_9MICO|nr:Pr6Pr family membrane protein [Agromyces marinus]UIP58002.1 hypothetical protein DSM26151_08720 [Agromyces marinus]BDZ53791.1 hypothetical protein GCM10025870_08640 [Agromyces marinus]